MVYLQGAYELRNGVPNAGGIKSASPDTIRAMPPDMLFDYFAVRLNGPNAAGKNLTLNVNFTDLNKEYGLTVENAVLNYSPEPVPNANARISLAKSTLDQILGFPSYRRDIALKEVVGDGTAKFRSGVQGGRGPDRPGDGQADRAGGAGAGRPRGHPGAVGEPGSATP